MTTSKATTMALAELTEKGADVDSVREMIRLAADDGHGRRESVCGGGMGSKSGNRQNHRNFHTVLLAFDLGFAVTLRRWREDGL